MKFQVMSDLHFEFQLDEGARFFKNLEVVADNLILAGDVNNIWKLVNNLQLFSKRYKNVIFVPGNHEFYLGVSEDTIPGYGRRMVLDTFNTALEVTKEAGNNLYVLCNDVIDLEGVKIAGTTMWFPDQPDNSIYENEIADFRQIPAYRSWVYKEAKVASKFLQNVGDVDIVVTHHIPTYQSHREPCDTDRFFVNPVLDKYDWPTFPKYWIHGHTHDSVDRECGPTRVICNPFGYQEVPKRTTSGVSYISMLNPNFNPNFVIEI